MRDRSSKRCLQLFRMEAERAGAALVGDLAICTNQVNAIRPAAVSSLNCIVESVNDGGKLDPQLAHATTGNCTPFFLILRTGEDNVIADVALHLPHVAGMRFHDVDRQEAHAVTILFVQLVEGGDLPPKWRSGVATEDQRHGLATAEAGELNGSSLVVAAQGEIRRMVAIA